MSASQGHRHRGIKGALLIAREAIFLLNETHIISDFSRRQEYLPNAIIAVSMGEKTLK